MWPLYVIIQDDFLAAVLLKCRTGIEYNNYDGYVLVTLSQF